tara:strand:+ start:76 stop:801 length:726 start_codon:yes stop_codon:yes gene_type:complete
MVENNCRRNPHDPLRGSNIDFLSIIDKQGPTRLVVSRVLIVGNAKPEQLSKWQNLIDNCEVIIACDGAMHNCVNSNISVDFLIGDMDSISSEMLDHAKTNNVKILAITDQGNSDLSKALNFARSLKPMSIDIIGADGGQSDHQFANYLTLFESPKNVCLHLDDSIVLAVTNANPVLYSIENNRLFSVFSIGPSSGVTITGAEWELDNASMNPNSLGLHNRTASEEISITCETGNLLVFIHR